MPVVLESSDFDELTEAQQNWDIRYRPLEKGKFHSCLAVNANEYFQADFESWSHSVEIGGVTPNDSYGFCINTDKNHLFRSREEIIDDSQLLFFKPNTSIHAISGDVKNLTSITINAEFLDNLFDGSIGEQLNKLCNQQSVMKFKQTELLPIQKMAMTTALDEDADWEQKSRWVTSEIITQLSMLLLKDIEHQLKQSKTRQYALARRARDIMLENIDSPPTLLEVCRKLAVSERTLLYTFKNIFGVSPKAFLKMQRLNAVRNTLKYSNSNKSIAEISTRFGFFDAGHFAKDYKAMFGELPSETRSRYS